MTAKAKILIVDDEANTLASLSRAFRLAGHEAVVCDNAARGLEIAQSQPFDLILSDVVMPRRDGLALLEDLKAAGIAAPVVMMSGQAHIEMAVRATRLGALDFLEKPLSTEKLLVTLENALKLTRLETENRDLRTRVGKHTLVWTGETMRRVMAQLERVAASETRVSGTSPARRSSRIDIARRPISCFGWRMVVSGGVVYDATNRSSKPAMETSSGTRRPRSPAARRAPSAVMSL